MDAIARLVRDEGGATAIEYVLIAALVALTCMAAFTTFGASASGKFQYVSDSVAAAAS